MQTTLLGLAIAFIIALIAALDRAVFHRLESVPAAIRGRGDAGSSAHRCASAGALDARLLPAPSLRLRSVVVGGANDLGKVRADKLDVEFSLGSLMRGEMARHRADHQRHGARSRPRSAGPDRLAGLDRNVQSGLAGDRPPESHRPHRAA